MRGRVSPLKRAFLVVLGLASFGCVKDYRHPTPDQPHAIVKFRRHYDQTPGTSLKEVLLINEQRAFRTSIRSNEAGVARTDAVLIHPGPAPVEMKAVFSHYESYTTTESYSCGTTDSPRTCTRTVTRNRTVMDGACKREHAFVFDPGKNYLLSLNYQDRRNCSTSCLIQTPIAAGKFKNEPCPVAVLND